MFAKLALDIFPDWTIDVVLSSASQAALQYGKYKLTTDKSNFMLMLTNL